MSKIQRALIGLLWSSASVTGCADVADQEPFTDESIPATGSAMLALLPPAGMDTTPIPARPKTTTVCGPTEAGSLSPQEVYDLGALHAELREAPALQAATGLDGIDSCEDARLLMHTRRALEAPGFADAQPAPVTSGGPIQKFANGRVRSLAGSVHIGIFGATRQDDMSCSGTLVGKSSLITAAHCFHKTLGNSSGQVWVVVRYRSPSDNRDYFISDSTVTTTGSLAAFKFARVDIHPNYTGARDVSDDLAIVTLPDIGPRTRIPQSWTVPNGRSDFMPIAIDPVGGREELRFHGYGVTASGRTDLGTPRVPADDSKRKPDSVASDGSSFFIRGTSTFQACSGDSGGPAYTAFGNRRLFGAFSEASAPAGPGLNSCAGVGGQQWWTSIFPKLDWIEARIEAFRSGACTRDSINDEMRCF